MEKHKIALRSSLDKLKEDSNTTVQLLNTLINKFEESVLHIESLSGKEFIQDTNRFLNVSKNQSEGIQNILSINIQLESFLIEIGGFDNKLASNTTLSCLSLNSIDTTTQHEEPIIRANSSESLSSHESIKSQDSKTLSQKLVGANYMSRIDKYKSKLPKGLMPDLTFKSSSKSSTEYESFSNSETQLKTRHRKKKRPVNSYDSDSSICAPVPAKSEGFLEIQEAELPNLNDMCMIACFFHPGNFYVHVANENTSIIDSMELQLNEWCKQIEPNYATKVEAKLAIGQYGIVYNSDWNSWYRAEIVNWKDSVPYNVEVQFIDYGDRYIVSYKKIRILPNAYRNYPKLALNCNLAYLHPIDAMQGKVIDKWSESAINKFAELLNSTNATQLYRIVYIDTKTNSVSIDLLRENERYEENTVGQGLIDSGLATQIIPNLNEVMKNNFFVNQVQTAQGMSGITANQTEEEQVDLFYSNMSTKEPDNLVQALTGYDAKDEMRICPFMKNDGKASCFKGRNCRLEHTLLRKDGYTTDKLSTFVKPKVELALPESGDDIIILITHMVSVNQFYGYLRTHDPTGSQLKTLISLMNAPETIKTYESIKTRPALGEMIIAKHFDEKFYRAIVTEVEPNIMEPNTFEVFFVDFGEPMEVKLKDVKLMKDIFLNLPNQAVNFCLSNVKPNDSNVDELREFFESKYIYQDLNAKVKYVGLSYVEVIVFNDQKDIGLELIEAGFGDLDLNDSLLRPADHEMLLIE